VFTPAGTAQFFESLGLPGPLAYLTILVEVAGAVALILGLFTRWVALALVPILVGAIVTVHGSAGFSSRRRTAAGNIRHSGPWPCWFRPASAMAPSPWHPADRGCAARAGLTIRLQACQALYPAGAARHDRRPRCDGARRCRPRPPAFDRS